MATTITTRTGGTVTDAIAKANAVCVVTGTTGPFDGSPHTASGACHGVIGEGEGLAAANLSGTTHTDVGDYPTDPWTFAGQRQLQQRGRHGPRPHCRRTSHRRRRRRYWSMISRARTNMFLFVEKTQFRPDLSGARRHLGARYG